MVDKRIVTPDDLGDGIFWNENTKKYEAISQISFTEREATVNLAINDMRLLFREVANSNRLMVATGINYNNVWYGDAPDNEQATNPFTNQPVSSLEPLSNLVLKSTDVDGSTIIVDNGKLTATQETKVYNIPTSYLPYMFTYSEFTAVVSGNVVTYWLKLTGDVSAVEFADNSIKEFPLEMCSYDGMLDIPILTNDGIGGRIFRHTDGRLTFSGKGSLVKYYPYVHTTVVLRGKPVIPDDWELK